MTVHPWNRLLWQEITRDLGNLPHALLLQGPRGVGKRDFALALANRLLCEAPTKDGACGKCKACAWLEQGSHPDFRLIEPESDGAREDVSVKKGGRLITIDGIRRLSDFLGLASHQGGWRTVVIHPAEAMNQAAANALLKTLEEPPADVLLILIAHQPRRLLPTVLSRCRQLAFGLPGRGQARDWLSGAGFAKAVGVLDEVGGAPLLAVEYADQERLARRDRFVSVLAKPDAASLSQLAQECQSRVDESWGWLTRWLYDLLAVGAAGQVRYFPEHSAALARLARQAATGPIWLLQQELARSGRWLHHPLNGQLLLESWLLRYQEAMEVRDGR